MRLRRPWSPDARRPSYTYSLSGKGVIQQIRVLALEQGRQILACSEAGFIAIALTAYAGEYDQKQALAAGFQQHIPKPVEPDI